MLNTLFFSKNNITNIQKGIRRRVYELSNGNYLISDQSSKNLMIIMKLVYKNNGLYADTHITEQIKQLNEIVMKESVLKIISSIQAYKGYLEDIDQRNTNQFELPANTSIKGRKLEYENKQFNLQFN